MPQFPTNSLVAATATVFSLALALPTRAVDTTWTNAGTGLFSLGSNWDTGNVPTTTDQAIIANGGTAQIQAGDSLAVDFLTVNNGGLDQSGGEIVSSNTGQPIRIGNLTGTVSFTQTGGTLASSQRLYFADGQGSATNLSTVTASIGGTASANDYIVIGRQGGTATVTVTGNLTKSTGTNRFIVGDGNAGLGTLSVEGTGAVTSTTGFDIGNGNGSVGIVTVKNGATLSSGLNGGNTQLIVGGGANAGSTGTGTLNIMDTAAVTSTAAEFWVGNGAGSNGTVNMSGGTLAVGNWVAIGRVGTGTFNLSGGTVTKTGAGNFILNGSTGTLTQTGGAINVNSGETWLSETADRTSVWDASAGTANLGSITRIGYGGTGTMTISGTANYTNGTVYVSSNGGSTGTLNLNGGTFTANHIEEGAGTGVINFNGGVMRAGADDANFLQDFHAGRLNVQAGGMILDTNSHTLVMLSSLSGVGGIAVQGGGMLVISAANTFAGASSIATGTTVALSGSLDNASSLSIANGATLELAGEGISLNDSIQLTLGGTGILTLDNSGTEVIGSLVIDGHIVAPDTYTASQLTALGFGGTITGSGSLQVTAVPEPSTVALLIGGLGVILYGFRTRRRA